MTRVSYIYSQENTNVCDEHPKTVKRASMVHSLIAAYNLLPAMEIVEPIACTRADLLMFHSEGYVDALESAQRTMDDNGDLSDCFDEDELDVLHREYGLGYDCALFRDIHVYAKAVCGGTVTAARCLSEGRADVSFYLNGGWHHAKPDEATGFCYVNDIVIGILHLMNAYKKILYVDIDCHHGDLVEEAFVYTNRVTTLSFHHYGNGFFPGTGNVESVGKGKGKYRCVNVPFNAGVDDNTFIQVFEHLCCKLMSCFQPDVLVMQCGADHLTGDPLGCFNLTSKSAVACVKTVMTYGIPTLILGGGGYNLPNTCRCWTEIVGAVIGETLHEDIPEHEYFEHYGPGYTLNITPSNRKNENSDDYIKTLIQTVNSNISLIVK